MGLFGGGGGGELKGMLVPLQNYLGRGWLHPHPPPLPTPMIISMYKMVYLVKNRLFIIAKCRSNFL